MLKMLVFGNLKFPVQNISVFLDGFSLCWKNIIDYRIMSV